jgi:hypothetical protein
VKLLFDNTGSLHLLAFWVRISTNVKLMNHF